MRTYVNTFSNVTTKVLTYSHLQSLTQGFGLGPKWDIIWAAINQKSLTECSVRDFCGEDEIRTRGTE